MIFIYCNVKCSRLYPITKQTAIRIYVMKECFFLLPLIILLYLVIIQPSLCGTDYTKRNCVFVYALDNIAHDSHSDIETIDFINCDINWCLNKTPLRNFSTALFNELIFLMSSCNSILHGVVGFINLRNYYRKWISTRIFTKRLARLIINLLLNVSLVAEIIITDTHL